MTEDGGALSLHSRDKYSRMLRYGVPERGVRDCMIMDGIRADRIDAHMWELRRSDPPKREETEERDPAAAPRPNGGGIHAFLSRMRRALFGEKREASPGPSQFVPPNQEEVIAARENLRRVHRSL